MNISDLWKKIEEEAGSNEGFFLRQYSADIKPELYAGLKLPDKKYLIILRVSYAIGMIADLSCKFNGIHIERVKDPDSSGNKLFIILTLSDNTFLDVFCVLVEDVIQYISELTDEATIIKSFLARLTTWQALFEQYKLEGLTNEEQQGLYGELCFLRKILTSNANSTIVIDGWKGPNRTAKDFKYGDVYIEVKTSAGRTQKIHISNEFQLDCTKSETLFLFHLLLSVNQESETLPQIIASINKLLQEKSKELISFNEKLIRAGYFAYQEKLYCGKGYQVIKEYIYKVDGEFPRLTASEIKNGVAEVKYTIALAQCMKYALDEHTFFTSLILD